MYKVGVVVRPLYLWPSTRRNQMNWISEAIKWAVDSGVPPNTSRSEAKYIRFINATLVLFSFAQLPILSLLMTLNLWLQVLINLGALGLCGLGFVLNRQGRHLSAKVLVILVLTVNTTYFAVIIGSNAPVHLWLIPMAVLGVLVFKPSERRHMTVF